MRIDSLDLRGTGTGVGIAATSSFTQTWKGPSVVNWSSYVGNPTTAGAKLTGTAAYQNTNQGILVPQARGTYGAIAWYLTGSNAFDFRKDFRATATVFYQATVANLINGDGFYLNFGGTGSSDLFPQHRDGSYCMRYETYDVFKGSYGTINGAVTQLDTTVTSQVITAMSSRWCTFEVELRSYPMQNKRFATMTLNGTHNLGAQDITSWPAPPSGTFAVGGWMGDATANHYIKGVTLKYL